MRKLQYFLDAWIHTILIGITIISCFHVSSIAAAPFLNPFSFKSSLLLFPLNMPPQYGPKAQMRSFVTQMNEFQLPFNTTELDILMLSDGTGVRPTGTQMILSGSMGRLEPHVKKANFISTDFKIVKSRMPTPLNVKRMTMDNTQPFLDFGTKFHAITLFSGLCAHQSSPTVPVGCAGIPLTKSGMANLLFQTTPLLHQNGLVLMHGHGLNKASEESGPKIKWPVNMDIVNNLNDGIRYFNSVQGAIDIVLDHDSESILGKYNTGIIVTGRL